MNPGKAFYQPSREEMFSTQKKKKTFTDPNDLCTLSTDHATFPSKNDFSLVELQDI